MTKAKTSAEAFLQAANVAAEQRYELSLFIAGATPLSAAALANIVDVCEERLRGRYDLVVIDVYQEPARAKANQIIAVPTLVKKAPLPARRLIGDLSDRALVLHGLGVPIEPQQDHEKDP